MSFINPLDFNLKHPITIKGSRPTLCGQNRLVRRILEEHLIKPFVTRIISVYSKWQLDYHMIRERYLGIEFEKKWREKIFDSLSPEQRNILILDDQIGRSKFKLVCGRPINKIRSLHRNLTVIYLVQYVYNQGKS